jgi:hypothetical protein
MAIIVGSARIDENGNIHGGKAGDQTGKEVSTQNFYVHSKGWYILRPKSVTYANRIAKKMKAACDNNKIGYDQYERLGVINEGIDTAVKTESDCSTLVRACIQEATGKKIANFTTANEVAVLEGTGLFHDAVAYISQAKTPVYNGDVLVTKTKGHTVIVVSGNARDVKASTDNTYYDKYTGSSTQLDLVLKAIGVPEKYRGTWSRRKPLAQAQGIKDYRGTKSQNITLVSLAKLGKLKKVV